MARSENSLTQNLDWFTILLYLVCVFVGWVNVYAAIFSPEEQTKIFDMSNSAGKQLLWIGTSFLLIIAVLAIDHKFYDAFAVPIYGFFVFLLVAVLILGTPIKGSRSWFKIGTFSLQPAEFAKLGTSLALARLLSYTDVKLNRWRDIMQIGALIIVPALLIILSNETGQTLVFATFIIVLYREGLPGIYPVLAVMAIVLFVMPLFFTYLQIFIGLVVLLGLVYYLFIPRYNRDRKLALLMGGALAVMMAYTVGVNATFEKVLKPHQQNRIKVLVNPQIDPRGVGWNVTQSKIAIGSGRMWGKGFLDGTQTKFDFVPEQQTDFIFCTIGEEHGFVGSLFVVALFVTLMCRIVFLAEKQRSRFARVYGYCVASIFFFHFLVNIGMTIGLVPVIGIPLPFFSYGGSSMWSFTLLLFIFLKLDSQRVNMLSR